MSCLMAAMRIEQRICRPGPRRVNRALSLRGRAMAIALAVFVQALGILLGTVVGANAQAIAPSALAEIRGLEQEKASRNPAQQKLDSNLIYAHQKARTGVAS